MEGWKTYTRTRLLMVPKLAGTVPVRPHEAKILIAKKTFVRLVRECQHEEGCRWS